MPLIQQHKKLTNNNNHWPAYAKFPPRVFFLKIILQHYILYSFDTDTTVMTDDTAGDYFAYWSFRKQFLLTHVYIIVWQIDLVMGDSRQSVQTLQSQLDEFRDRSRRELQDSQRLNKERQVEMQRTQNSLKAAQEEVREKFSTIRSFFVDN